VFCGTYIYLNADVDGDLRGHTIEWEQISGQPVLIDDIHSQSTFYERLENSNKTFRFWIDKGRATEQYDDLIIYGTPTETLTGTTTQVTKLTRGIATEPVPCETILGTTTLTIGPPTQLHGESTNVNYQMDVTWDLPPTYNDNIDEMVLYKDGVPVGTFSILDNLSYDGATGNYSVLTKYNFGIHPIDEQPSCEKTLTVEVDNLVRAVDDAVVSSTGAISFLKTSYLPVVERITNSLPTSLGTITYNKATYITTIETVVNDMTASTKQLTELNISRYDPQAIGG
jgi:hypothetical protein